MNNGNKSLITDINEARREKEENNQGIAEQNKDPFMEAMENTDFTLSTDQSMEEQVQNLHGKLLLRVVKKIKMAGGEIDQNDVSMIAQTIIKVMEQKMMFALLEKVGFEDITNVIDTDDQEELIDMFGIQSSLNVSQEDLENLENLKK